MALRHFVCLLVVLLLTSLRYESANFKRILSVYVHHRRDDHI